MRYRLDIDSRIKSPGDTKPENQWDLPTYVCFTGLINEESARQFRSELEYAENRASKAKQNILPIVIDTYGGQVYALLSMIDAIRSVKMPIATIVESKAMSCGAILFSFGSEGYRFINPNATLMIHDVSSFSFGKVEDLKADARECERLNRLVYSMMARNCGKSESYFYDKVTAKRGADWYLTPNECIEHNLANRIHSPTLTCTVSVDIDFG